MELDKRRFVDLNGHVYHVRRDYEFGSLTELLDEIFHQVPDEVIVNGLNQLSEEEIKKFLLNTGCVNFENDKFILKDKDYWSNIKYEISEK